MEERKGDLIRDFIVFQLKLALDGIKDLLAINLSIGAFIIDLMVRNKGEQRLFYRVVGMSEGFEKWLKLHKVKGGNELAATEGTARTSIPDADSMIDELEEMARRRTGW